MGNLLSIALNPDLAWPQSPFAWEVSGTHLCGRAESPELAFHDGIAAYAKFVNQQAGWDG
jgi:hypothetical protein